MEKKSTEKKSDVRFSLQVLVVDDDANIRRTLALSLKDLGCSVEQASSVSEALASIKAREFDLVLTDFKMESQTGLDLIREAKAIAPNLTLAVMTAYTSFQNAVAVIKEGAFDYLPKPFTHDQLIHLLNKVSELSRLRRENSDFKRTKSRRGYFSGFTSSAMTALEEFVRQVAPTDSTVLLTGESGTGKSELAKLIHELSPRSDRPFVTVYCTTLTESLLESELFGHIKGSFTGALQDKIGKLELADGGTLFLDEIGDLTPNGQSKLLRFLQDRVFERIGSNHEIVVNTRVIAATNKNLDRAVTDGKFRQDLLYRLNMLECILTPLRHRSEDIPILIERILGQIAPSLGVTAPIAIAENIRARLLAHPWPGNIRELRNVLERLITLSRGRPMALSDLPDSFNASPAKISTTASDGPLGTLEEMEKALIMRVLATESNQERAAEILGVTKVTLWRKRKEYGLP